MMMTPRQFSSLSFLHMNVSQCTHSCGCNYNPYFDSV